MSTVQYFVTRYVPNSHGLQFVNDGHTTANMLLKSVLEYRYSNIDILKFKPSQFQYYIDILKFKPNQFRFFRNWQRFTQSLTKRSHAHTRTNKLMYSYNKRVCIASHSVQCVANRFRNNMSMSLFQAFPPSLRYITVNAVHRWQAQSLTYYCEIYSQHASCNAYSFSV